VKVPPGTDGTIVICPPFPCFTLSEVPAKVIGVNFKILNVNTHSATSYLGIELVIVIEYCLSSLALPVKAVHINLSPTIDISFAPPSSFIAQVPVCVLSFLRVISPPLDQ
jgi:hypothetical protein